MQLLASDLTCEAGIHVALKLVVRHLATVQIPERCSRYRYFRDIAQEDPVILHHLPHSCVDLVGDRERRTMIVLDNLSVWTGRCSVSYEERGNQHATHRRHIAGDP